MTGRGGDGIRHGPTCRGDGVRRTSGTDRSRCADVSGSSQCPRRVIGDFDGVEQTGLGGLECNRGPDVDRLDGDHLRQVDRARRTSRFAHTLIQSDRDVGARAVDGLHQLPGVSGCEPDVDELDRGDLERVLRLRQHQRQVIGDDRVRRRAGGSRHRCRRRARGLHKRRRGQQRIGERERRRSYRQRHRRRALQHERADQTAVLQLVADHTHRQTARSRGGRCDGSGGERIDRHRCHRTDEDGTDSRMHTYDTLRTGRGFNVADSVSDERGRHGGRPSPELTAAGEGLHWRVALFGCALLVEHRQAADAVVVVPARNRVRRGLGEGVGRGHDRDAGAVLV